MVSDQGLHYLHLFALSTGISVQDGICKTNQTSLHLEMGPRWLSWICADWRPGCGFDPHRGRQHSYVEIDHEIFSTVILSLPLSQEGHCQFLPKECVI